MATDDLALLAHRLDRRSYLHGPFPRVWPGDALWLPRELPLLHHGWRARRGIAHARTVEDSKGGHAPAGGERSTPDARGSSFALESSGALVPGIQDPWPVGGDGDG